MWPDKDSPGYGSFVRNLSDGFVENGFEVVHKALIIGKPNLKIAKIKSYSNYYWHVLKGFIQGGYDLIYIHFPNQTIPMLRMLYSFRQPKIVVNYHGEDLLYYPKGYKGILGRMTDKFIRRHATKVVVPSNFFKEIIEKRGTTDVEKIIVSPSGGIAENIFYPPKAISNSQIFSEENPIKLGYIGRLEPEKGIHVFLEVLKKLISMRFPFKATIIGYGSQEKDVTDFISNPNVKEKVNYIPGLPQQRLGEIYRNIDLLIFPTLAHESLGLTGIESMACGTPVIGSRLGGVTTYLKDGYNGFLVAPGSPSEIIERIIQYTEMPEKQQTEIREHCISTSRRYYSSYVCNELSSELDAIINKA